MKAEEKMVASINVYALDIMEKCAKSFDRRCGTMLCTSQHVDGNRYRLMAKYEHPEFITKRDNKTLVKELSHLITERLKIELEVSVVGSLTEEPDSVLSKALAKTSTLRRRNIKHTISPTLLREFFDLLMQGAKPEHRSRNQKDIDMMLRLIYEDQVLSVSQSEFMDLFLQLMLPDIVLTIKHYPDETNPFILKTHGIWEVIKGLVADVERCTAMYASVQAGLKDFMQPDLYLALTTLKAAPPYLSLLTEPAGIRNLEQLNQLKCHLDKVKHFIDKKYLPDIEIENLCVLYRDLCARLHTMMGFLESHKIVDPMQDVISKGWLCYIPHYAPKEYEKNGRQLTLYHQSMVRDKLIIELIKRRLNEIQPVLQQRIAAAQTQFFVEQDAKREAARQQQAEAKRQAALKQAETLSSSPPVMTSAACTFNVVNNPVNVTAECKRNAREIELRDNSRLKAKWNRAYQKEPSDRTYGTPVSLWSAPGQSGNDQQEEAVVAQSFTVTVFNKSTDETFEVDLTPARTADRQAMTIWLQGDMYLMIRGSFLEGEMDEPLRNLLTTNEGNGFLKQDSTGSTGLKLISSEKNEPLLYLKRRDESRIVCARKLVSIDGKKDPLHLFVPIERIANHVEYEKHITDKDYAKRVRKCLEKQFEIVEAGYLLADQPGASSAPR